MGALTPIHKLDRTLQEARRLAGEPEKLRPVNSGPTVTKIGLKLALDSPSGDRAKKALRPIQLGLGTAAGPEKMVTACRAAHAAGMMIKTTDCENGFNAFIRQTMVDSQHRRWPEGTRTVNAIYGPKSVAIYVFTDSSNTTHVWVMMSEEGSRMGDILGNFLFDNGADDNVYGQLATAFPDWTLRALTDDLQALIPCPPADADYAEWVAHYERVARFDQRFNELGAPHGARANADKSKILLPQGAPDPPGPQDSSRTASSSVRVLSSRAPRSARLSSWASTPTIVSMWLKRG